MRTVEGRRKRVVVLLDSLESLGGAETLAVDLAIGLDPERHERTICLTHDQAPFARQPPQAEVLNRLKDSGVEVLELGRRSRFSFRPWIRFIRYLRSRRVDVIHAHKFGSNAWGVVCGRLAQVPTVIAHEHMWSYTESSAVRKFVDRRVIGPGADALIAVSEEGRRQMVEVVGVRPDQVEYIPNGVPDGPPADRPAARAALGASGEEILIGTVALLRPEKELGLLIEATGFLCGRGRDVRAVIVGEGPERPRLEALVSRLGLAGSVSLVGYRDDVQTLLPGFDLAVCCSRFEGGPLSVMEYMEARLPIVATHVGGLPELLADGECGVLVEPGDPEALADGLESLLADPNERSAIGARAFERKRAVYSLEAWIRRMEALYDRGGACVTTGLPWGGVRG